MTKFDISTITILFNTARYTSRTCLVISEFNISIPYTITSNFHIFRAKHIAEKLGQEDVITVASSADPILVLHLWVREGLAVLKDKFMGRM